MRTATTSLLAAASALLSSPSARAADTPSSSQYTDTATGISFIGYADGTGFQFGMALPSDPKKDMIVQLVGPLNNGGGWTGVDFGESMKGRLLLVAWPSGNQVMMSPRIATGYEVENGANVYDANKLTLTPIAKGTFVNSTHVSATFLCAGCITGSDGFSASEAQSTFSFAYALTPVANPGNVNTQLSDHTANGEPYGPFSFTTKGAKSAQYDKWVAMTKEKATSGTESGNGTESSASGSGSTPSSASSGLLATGATGEEDFSADMGPGYWAVMVVVGLLYLSQPFL